MLKSLCAVVLLLPLPCLAAELELRYNAMERLLAEQLFSQDGRLYVRGSRTSKCTFAYLESPRLGTTEHRLQLTARFSGRSALDMFGGCVGLGDSFEFTMTAIPVVRNGALALDQVNVQSKRDSYYIRKVKQALTASFAKSFKIEVRDQAKKLLEQPGPPADTKPADGKSADSKPAYERELSSFDLRDVRVEPAALLLVIDFRLVVK